MRRFKWFALAVLALGLGGCAGFYSLFGIQEDGTVTPGGGVLGTVATLVNYWIPGAAALAGTVTTTLAAIKAAHTIAGVGTLVEKALDKYVRPESV